MAVQQRRKSKSKTHTRRAHDRLGRAALSEESMTGETHRRHHISPDGYYRGRKVIAGTDE